MTAYKLTLRADKGFGAGAKSVDFGIVADNINAAWAKVLRTEIATPDMDDDVIELSVTLSTIGEILE